MNDKQAEKIITKFILKEMKKKGIIRLSPYEIGQNVNVPMGQIERVLDKFIKEKRIKEI